MIKGLYAAASAMLAGLTRQQTLAHNIANMDTPGFKQLTVDFEDFLESPVFNPLAGIQGSSTSGYLGSVGLGVEKRAELTDFAAGGLKLTGQPLDLAIEGNGFFRVRTPEGERYTRDGRFLLDAENQLVTVDGYLVLGESGEPVILDGEAGVPSISSDGTIVAGGEEVARLGLAVFTEPEKELARDLPNTFIASGAPAGEGAGSVVQGYLEMANINPAELMTQMVAVARAYEAAQKMVQTQDELLGQTIATLGRL
jgi:flagellar basal-body rod protein FlgF